MKKLFKLSVLVLFLVSACSKDDSSDDISSSDFLLGKWESTEYIDEHGEKYPEPGEFVTFTENRVTFEGEGVWMSGTEMVYEYLPDSQELVLANYVVSLEVIDNNHIFMGGDDGVGTNYKRIQ
ncbi:hypothetical protein [Salegentibacter mishustinae]|uniref:hypothetical protein n=1 Tax=Salegentibacter mishustinae TaxID=270918 RepID=UPI002491EC53|nr:hypothetical protein [Salegentibacter mishustinae]